MLSYAAHRLFPVLSVLLALVGFTAVAAHTLPGMHDAFGLPLRLVLVVIWAFFFLNFAVTFAERANILPSLRPALISVDALCAVVPVLTFAFPDGYLCCGIWVLQLVRNSTAFRLISRVIAAEGSNLVGVMAIFITLLLGSALLVYVFERDGQPEAFGSIPKAMWWSIATLSTTGYGDAVPKTMAGSVLGGLIMVCGIGVVALWTGILASGFAEEIRRQDFVRSWQLVGAVPLFRNLGSADLVEIVRALKRRTMPAGTVICRKGEPGDRMFFLADGTVRIAATPPVDLGSGAFFGEIALLTGEPRMATVTAATTVTVLSLHAADFQLLIGRSPELASTIKRVALERQGKAS